jgi:hypothetical protein
MSEPSTLQRFIDHVQAAIGHNALTDDTGGRVNLERLRHAIPIAKSIVLFNDPLDATGNDGLDSYIKAQCAALDAGPDAPTDPGHELEKAAAESNATYFVGLAVGLLLADQVQT